MCYFIITCMLSPNFKSSYRFGHDGTLWRIRITIKMFTLEEKKTTCIWKRYKSDTNTTTEIVICRVLFHYNMHAVTKFQSCIAFFMDFNHNPYKSLRVVQSSTDAIGQYAMCTSGSDLLRLDKRTCCHTVFACKDFCGSTALGDRLVGLVVKASASRAEDPGFESRLHQDVSGVEPHQWLKNWHSSDYPARRLAL